MRAWGTSGCSPSHCQSGLDVGRAPTRSTTSGGACPSQPAAARGSAAEITRLRSWPPARAPESGSARMGNPQAAAQAAAAAGRAGSSCGPRTSRPRRPATRAARRSTASGVGRSRPGRTVGGAAEGAGRGPVGTSGSRKRRLRCTGPGGDSRAAVTRRAARAAARPGAAMARGGRLQVVGPLDRRSVDAGLVDRLGGADPLEIGRPVGGDEDERDPAVAGFHRSGQELGGRRPRGAHRHRREAGGPGDAEGEEGRGALVEVRPVGDAGLLGEGQGQRSAARSRGDAGVGHAERGEGPDQRDGELVVAIGHGREPYPGRQRAGPIGPARSHRSAVDQRPSVIDPSMNLWGCRVIGRPGAGLRL